MTVDQFIRSSQAAPPHPFLLAKNSSITVVSRVTDPSAPNNVVVSREEAKILSVSRASDRIRVQYADNRTLDYTSAELAKLEYTVDHPRGLNWAHSLLDNTVRTPWQIADICWHQEIQIENITESSYANAMQQLLNCECFVP